MTTATAIIALLISIASLAFGVYQYRILHRVRVREKATALLRLMHDLRRKSQDLQYTIDSTDHMDDHAEFLAKVNALTEIEGAKIATSKNTSLETLIEVEQLLLPMELEIDLLFKQAVELGRFNGEVREHEAAIRKQHEA
jgi:hypothetical protein